MQSPAYALFIGTLIFAPLAFGSVETWSIGLVEILVSLATLTYLFEVRDKSKPFLKVPGILPIFLLILFMWVQLIPLPASIVSVIAPGIYQAYAPMLNLQDTNHWIPLTVNQKSTLLEALRITTYAFFYILTVQLLSHKKLLLKTTQIVAGLTTIIAFIAILQKFTSPDLIYWFRPAPSIPVGPWVYRNHYAGFMELAFPLVLALFFYYRPKLTTQQSFRSKVVSIFSSPNSNIQFFLGFSFILILSSIFIGLSRGGIVCANLALFFFLTLLANKSTNSAKLLPLIVFGCVLLAVTWFGWDPILARFNESTTESGIIVDRRWHLYLSCLPLIKDFFVSGSGFGTFIHVFPQYNTLPTSVIFDHAHNDYIELITDGGLIGFFLAAWFVITIFVDGIKKLSIRRDPYSILLIIAGLTGIFSILLHSFVDFNMHNGANGLYFFFLCGITISAGNTRIHFRNRPTLLKTVPPTWKLGLFAALPMLLLVFSIQGGIFIAKQHYKQASKTYINPQLSDKILQDQLIIIDKAINLDSREGRYSSYKGNLLSYLQQNGSALHNYLQAARKDPLEGAYLQRIGLLLPQSKKEQASMLMAEGYKRGLNKKQLVFVLAEWYLKHNERQKAFVVLKQGAEQFPDIAKQLPQFFLFYKFNREEITAILPPKTSAWMALGEFLEKAGEIENSAYYRSHALDFLEQEESNKQGYILQLYHFYRRHKRTENAIATLHLGIKWSPNYAPFHIHLGDYYRQQKILYRAKEEYEQALILTPDDESIKKRLQSIK
jgi:tetratricopeptide (TPR) repeat protein/O-antigen ligase